MKPSIAIVLTTTLFALPAHAGWEATTWGMTPEQVESAIPNTKHLSHGDKLSFGTALSRGPYAFGDRKVTATYYYLDGGLSSVELAVPTKACASIAGDLAKARGAPLLMIDQQLMRTVIWHDDPADVRVRLLVSTGFCDVYFERLSTYRDHDRQEAGKR